MGYLFSEVFLEEYCRVHALGKPDEDLDKDEFIRVINASISFFNDAFSPEQKMTLEEEPSQETIEDVFKKTIRSLDLSRIEDDGEQSTIKKLKIGRNGPCRCGSGKKWKRI